MIKSMTGYGRAVETLLGREFTVEVRAVNNRYLDCTVKLPRSMIFAEDAVKGRVKAAVSRGKVDVFITIGASTEDQVQVTLNQPVLKGYLAAMRTMTEEYGIRDDISVSLLSRMPEVFQMDKSQEDEDAMKAALLQVTDQALAAFNAMRQTEGEAMVRDLRSRAKTIAEMVSIVEEQSPQTVSDYRARLEAKMAEVLAGTTIDESRILQEAAIFADKVAVDEETVRLRSHLDQMETMLASGGAIGRKLDFLLQEMNREANTIGSKCTDIRLARVVVDIKAELEKIREQTQNIE
ncbi:MAG: YicC family protein [Ruminococcaceae bacterium]|nr:YicC family protein [Oscillospiraceae bacterium]